MATKTMESWDAGDFSRSFRSMAAASPDQMFRERCRSLADALEPIDREFVKSTAQCGRSLASTMEEVQALAVQVGFCALPGGSDEGCSHLYRDVDQAVAKVEALREACLL